MSDWAITGTGLATAVGNRSGELWRALAGTPASGTTRPIPQFDPRRHIDRKGLLSLSRTSQLACVAGAGLAPALAGVAPEEIGVCLGTAWGTLDTIVRFERQAHLDGPRFVDPLLFTESVPNVPAGQVSIVFGWSAFNVTVAAGAVAGLEAIGQAIELLEDGRARVAVAGGADELNPHVLHCSGEGARPVGTGGEAGCLVAIESVAGARERGATILGLVRGCCGAFHDDGWERTVEGFVRELVEHAGLAGRPIAASVIAGEQRAARTLAAALVRATGPGAAPLEIGSVLGETWAASGPLAVAAALEALAAQDRRVEHVLVVGATTTGHLAGLVVTAPPSAA